MYIFLYSHNNNYDHNYNNNYDHNYDHNDYNINSNNYKYEGLNSKNSWSKRELERNIFTIWLVFQRRN
jgi:hypothetical protein